VSMPRKGVKGQAFSTITARATAPGRGGVGIIRVSGALVPKIAKVLCGKLPKPRYARFTNFYDQNGAVIDSGLALYFKSPNSFTGEDVLELHGHGGMVVLDSLLQRVIELGAVLAKPGEFSERAFLNGKIDLAEAEAIADLIDASSKKSALAAARSLNGEFSNLIFILKEKLILLRSNVEAAIDFSEEELDLKDQKAQIKMLDELLEECRGIQRSAKQGVLLSEGLTLALVGKPNVGKSSLLNRLTGEETAIVTDIPGTTRDIVKSHLEIDGLPVHILDTAGLRDSTQDPIEQEGMRRSRDALKIADRILCIIDAAEEKSRNSEEILARLGLKEVAGKVSIVFNKIDLSHENAALKEDAHGTQVYLSARTGSGLNLLSEHIKHSAGFASSEADSSFSARKRHLEALGCVEKALISAREQLLLHQNYELSAEYLRSAQNSLSEITGEFSSDDLLAKIFSEFCVGK